MKTIISYIVFACTLALLAHAAGAEGTRVDPHQEAKIDQHGICRIVKNNNSDAVHIPHRSASEWSSGANAFLNTMQKGLDVRSCPVCTFKGQEYDPGDTVALTSCSHVCWEGGCIGKLEKPGLARCNSSGNWDTIVKQQCKIEWRNH